MSGVYVHWIDLVYRSSSKSPQRKSSSVRSPLSHKLKVLFEDVSLHKASRHSSSDVKFYSSSSSKKRHLPSKDSRRHHRLKSHHKTKKSRRRESSSSSSHTSSRFVFLSLHLCVMPTIFNPFCMRFLL